MDRPPDGSKSNELALSLPLPSASGAARAAVRKRFAGALSRATIADLELVVSELVANGVRYDRGPVRIKVQHR